jgi:hypothetical protein
LAEEIMSKVSNPISFILLATAVLPSGIDVSLQSARADDCLAAPNASEPTGQHWYYEIDQQKARKCWYLHATILRLRHAASRTKSHAALRRKSHAALRRKSHAALRRKSHTVSTAVSAALTNMEPAARQVAARVPTARAEPAPEAASAAATVPPAAPGAASPATVLVAKAPPSFGPAEGVQPEPHIDILPVKTVPAPAIAAPMREAAQQSEATAATAVPTAKIGSKTAVGNSQSTGAGVIEVRSFNAQNGGSATEQQKPVATPGAADTVPTETFFLPAIGLSMLIFFAGVLSRIAARRRAVIITDYPRSAWDGGEAQSSYASPYEEQDLPFIDPQEQQKLANLQGQD